MSLIENRYAKALFTLNYENKTVDKSLDSLKKIVEVYSSNIELKEFLNSPKIKNTDKKDIIKKIFNTGCEKNVINFILLLLDKDRIKFLPSILTEYITLMNKSQNEIEIEILSAVKLSIYQIKKIENKFKNLYNMTKVKSKIEVDKSLIGGLKITIGDKIYDNSIKFQLQNLKNNLKIS